MTEHKLKNDTLTTVEGGIVAECVCGWTSGPRFSGMIASVALREHYTKETGRDYDKDNSDAAMVDRISKEPDA